MIKPLGDRVVVKPKEEEEARSPGGIIIPDTAKEQPQEGEVVAVGPGKLLNNGKRVPLPLKVGDIVIFSKYGGTEVRIEGEKYLILDFDSVLAVKEPDEKKS